MTLKWRLLLELLIAFAQGGWAGAAAKWQERKALVDKGAADQRTAQDRADEKAVEHAKQISKDVDAQSDADLDRDIDGWVRDKSTGQADPADRP